MHTKYLAFAIPLFLVFMGLEYFLSKVQGKKFYKFKDTIANLNVGIAERLIDCFSIGIFYFYYDYLQKNLGFFDIKSGVFLGLPYSCLLIYCGIGITDWVMK
jgi:hypothetical protein